MRSSKSAPKFSMQKLSLNIEIVPKKIDLVSKNSKAVLNEKNSDINRNFKLLSTNKKTRKENINYLKTEYITKFKLKHPFYLSQPPKNLQFNTEIRKDDKIKNINNIHSNLNSTCIDSSKNFKNKNISSKISNIGITPKKFSFDDIELKNHLNMNINKDKMSNTKITDFFTKKKNMGITNNKKFNLLDQIEEQE